MLSARAADARRANDPQSELATWREALDLLPPDARQAEVIRARIEALGHYVDASPPHDPDGSVRLKGLAGLGGLGLLLWKLKSVIAFVATKGKALLVGFTNLGTLAGVLASFGVYWAAWGWKFGLGLVLSLYVHEIGHIVALRRLGISASAPAFVPGLGAFVRMHRYPANSVENARVGLAGPIWGTAAALVTFAAFILTGWSSLAAIARFGAWLNLFNLLPVGPLDGGRGVDALDRPQRWVLAGAMGVAWLVTAEGLLGLLVLVALFRACGQAPTSGDRRTLVEYVVLIGITSGLCTITVPGGVTP